MRRLYTSIVCALLLATAAELVAAPVFVNGLRIRGSRTDATGEPGANQGRLGFFSDIDYDPNREEWWALSDRGPGGGVLDYATRVQKISLDVDPWTGRISHFRVLKTIQFTDPVHRSVRSALPARPGERDRARPASARAGTTTATAIAPGTGTASLSFRRRPRRSRGGRPRRCGR